MPKTVAEIRDELVSDLRDRLGADVDVSAESVLGQVVAIQATKLGELWELVGALYAARTPSGASGAALDALCEIAPASRAPRPRRAPLPCAWPSPIPPRSPLARASTPQATRATSG